MVECDAECAFLQKSKSSFKKLGPPKRQKSVILNEEVDIEVLMEVFANECVFQENFHLLENLGSDSCI